MSPSGARQCLKLALYTLWPFGRTTIPSPTGSPLSGLGNVLWFIPGVTIAFMYVVGGLGLCLTIIGIPFGIQSFKFAQLALFPFGKEIVRTKDLRSGKWAQENAVTTSSDQSPPLDAGLARSGEQLGAAPVNGQA